MGLNAIGHGQLTVKESTLYGRTLVNFRQDYGSTWEGDLIIRNCRWIPACGDSTWPHLFGVSNDGMHDFGYPCSMPKTITIDGLLIEDRNTPTAYDGPYFFTDPDAIYDGVERSVPTAERPFPYAQCLEMRMRGLECVSGKSPRISPNVTLENQIAIIAEA